MLGGPLEPCGTDPLTLLPPLLLDAAAVVTAEFLEHQRSIGNDLSTPVPEYRFPGLVPGDRWCVTAANWLRAHQVRAPCLGTAPARPGVAVARLGSASDEVS